MSLEKALMCPHCGLDPGGSLICPHCKGKIVIGDSSIRFWRTVFIVWIVLVMILYFMFEGSGELMAETLGISSGFLAVNIFSFVGAFFLTAYVKYFQKNRG